MRPEADKLKLGKGAAFVKSRLKYLRQQEDTWEADFFPIPCTGGKHDSVWMGLVLSHAHEYVLAQRNFEEPPTVNDEGRENVEAVVRLSPTHLSRPVPPVTLNLADKLARCADTAKCLSGCPPTSPP